MSNSSVSATRSPEGSGREAVLNWLALGLLLAAWNAADNDAGAAVRLKPEVLRGYSFVSVRAIQRLAATAR